MLAGTKSLEGGIFKAGTITNGKFDPKINFVQTTNIISFTFNVQNKIPQFTTGQYYPRILIVLPAGMTALESEVQINNLDGSMVEATMKYSVITDETFVFTSASSVDTVDCKQQVCYSILP